jgi:hypothetical protein
METAVIGNTGLCDEPLPIAPERNSRKADSAKATSAKDAKGAKKIQVTGNAIGIGSGRTIVTWALSITCR